MDSTEGGWAVVAEFEKEPIVSDSDDCKRMRQAETRALKKENTEKSKSSAFQPLPTLRNPTENKTTVSECWLQARLFSNK